MELITWSVPLRGIKVVQSVQGGTAQDDALGTLITPGKGAKGLTVRLSMV